MALASTPMVFTLALSDPERGVQVERTVRMARHPSETLERVWLRLLAYAWCYDERLEFGAGLCAGDDPDLAATDLTGAVTRVVLVGKPEARRIQRFVDRNPHARVSALFESPMRLDEAMREVQAEGLARVGRAELGAVEPALLGALAASESRRQAVELVLTGDHFYVQRDGESLDGPLLRASAQ